MKCSNCQAQLPDSARFCGSCGTQVAQAAPAAEPKLDFSAMQTIDPNLGQPPKSEGRKLEPGEVFATRYKITRLIGEGGMGNVYLASDSVTNRNVALKLVRADRLGGADAIKRLINEGVVSRDIRHSNVVAVYDVGEADGTPYFSMEYIQGRSLRAWNRDKLQGEAWSLSAAATIIREVLAGLEVAHRAGVVHRDLKPENVMLTSEPTDTSVQLKLLDFGIARAPGTAGSATALGSQGYMAPEQLTAPDTAQPSADLYSLSVMFYELLVGVVPLNYWQPPSGGRPDVPMAIDALIQKGLSPNPRARPQSVQEYRTALDAALATRAANPQGPNTWTDRPEVKEAIRAARDFVNHGFKPATNAEPERPRTIVGGGKASLPPLKAGSLWDYFMACVTKRYAVGGGRASRKEYWGFNIGALALVFAAIVVDVGAGNVYFDTYGNSYGEGPVVAIGTWLALLAPAIAVSSRRMHDLGYSGWIAALVAIPGIGNLLAIVMGLPAGARGANAYGPDPLAPGGSA